MNKLFKRFLSIILAAVLFAAMLPVDALAEDAEVTYPLTGSCGQDLTWSLDEQGTLTVSGEGEMAARSAP